MNPPDVYGTPVPQSGPERLRYAAEVMRLAADAPSSVWVQAGPRGLIETGRGYLSTICSWNWDGFDFRLVPSRS